MVGTKENQARRVPLATVQIISDIIDRRGYFGREKLMRVVCEELERLWPEDEWEAKAEEAGLSTTAQINTAIEAYWLALEEGRIASNKAHSRNISDGTINLIGEVARSIGSKDRIDILEAVCDHLESRFHGKSLEYHLQQMNIRTTSDILYAIDLYNVGREYHIFEKLA